MSNRDEISEKGSSILITNDRETKSSSLKIVLASSLGTMIEWYDFSLFIFQSTTIAQKFFGADNPVSNVISILATSAISFGVRPLGALIFGCIGDIYGRKFALILTLGIMGLATALIGCSPTFKDIGVGASGLLLALRIVQGLATAEYSIAATFIAEHAPAQKRGYYTSFIQASSTGGLILCLLVLYIIQYACGTELFDAWGWRIPFLFSIILVGPLIYIRLSLSESPLYLRLCDSGKTTKNPLVETFGSLKNLRLMAIALFGSCLGQGVVWYTSQIYAYYYLQVIFKLPQNDSYLIIVVALLLVLPFYALVGRLTDAYGRKPFMIAGLVLAIATYYPIYLAMYQFRYSLIATIAAIDSADLVVNPNYNPYALCFFVWLQTIYVSLIYGPITAFLVELFPTSIRCTSISLPYYIGNGICGGLVPVIGLIWIQSTGNIYAGLYYPLISMSLCLIIMVAFVPETYKHQLIESLIPCGPANRSSADRLSASLVSTPDRLQRQGLIRNGIRPSHSEISLLSSMRSFPMHKRSDMNLSMYDSALSVTSTTSSIAVSIESQELDDWSDDQVISCTEVAEGVFVPDIDRFSNINKYLTMYQPFFDCQGPLQEMAQVDNMILPCIPNDNEKTLYINTNSMPILLYSIIALCALSAGMWLFVLSHPAFYVFSLYNVYVLFFFGISFYTGMIGKDFDYNEHQELVQKFENRLMGSPASSYPSVDVYLPCCKEPLFVLQNTYEHVIRMNWPNFKVWVLDDGASDEVKHLAFKFGFNYIRRPDRPFLKKAGNMRYAFQHTQGEFYMVLDADFCPRREFLWECIPQCVLDPKIAVLQTPQYFRVRKNQTWVEQGATISQEMFYRVIQQKRDRLGGTMCVGTSALYRREALAPFGGLAAIEHSEDMMTGFMAICAGWKVKYLPVCMSMGICPENLQAYFNQQYRWAQGNIDLMCQKAFWHSTLPWKTKFCYIAGMLYYLSVPLSQLIYVAPSLLVIYVRPEYNISFAIPSILMTTFGLVAWTSQRYTFNILKAQVVQEYATLSAFKDRLLGTHQAWVPSGGKSGSTARFQQARIALSLYIFGSFGLIIAGSVWRSFEYGFTSFIPSIILPLLQVYASFQFICNMS